MLGWELPPHHTGGMGIVCYQMCKELAKTGADIEFVLPYTADFSHIDFMKINPAVPHKVDEVKGGPIGIGSTYDSQTFEYVMQDGTKRVTPMNEHQANYAEYARNLVTLGDYDVIHAHDWLTFRAALAAKQVSGKPLFVHIHSTEYDRAGGKHGNPLVEEIEYIGLHLADRIFAISKATKETIIRHYGIPADKIEIVHNAMEFEAHELHTDTTENAFKYLSTMRDAGYNVLVSAGRLTVQKGLVQLLHAFRKVVDLRPKSILLIVGNGDQYEELIEVSADLGLAGNVIFTGRLNGTGKQWRDAFAVGDLFIMPSVSEPFGITPFEALAQYTPALISLQSGVSEILQHVLKVDFWDIDQMVTKIVAVFDNPELAEELVINGRREMFAQSWRKSAEQMMRHYHHHVAYHKEPVYV